MFKEIVEAIKASVKPEQFQFEKDGETFVSKPVFRAPEKDSVTHLETFTLQSIVDYFTDIAPHELKNGFIHVASPSVVRVFANLDEFNARQKYLVATYNANIFQFGTYYDQDSFITGVRSDFVQNDARDTLLRFASTLTDESSLRLEDDGTRQKTTAQSGIANPERVEVPSPLTLKPHRTFAEIEQPDGEFILRLQKRENRKGYEVPTLALFKSDNDAWKVTAINSIKKFLGDKLKDVSIIG